MAKARVTRKKSEIFGLGNALTREDAVITASRLPTCRQVLRCVMFLVEEGASENRTRFDCATDVFAQVLEFYRKANIPTISDIKACQKIIALLDDNAKMRAIPCNRRETPSVLKKVEKMNITLDKTFIIWPRNAMELIKNEEDRQFLQSMMTDRVASFGTRDKVLADKIERKEARTRVEEDRRMRKMAAASSTAEKSESDDGSEDLGDSTEPGPSTRRSHHRTARTGTSVFIPSDIVKRPKLVALATRMKMTPAQQAVYTKALIEEAGGEVSKVSLSYSTADRSRRKVCHQISSAIMNSWEAPKLATLHWDSKLLSSLENKYVKEERLTVVVGNRREMKLLGVPTYETGTEQKVGETIAEQTVKLLNS